MCIIENRHTGYLLSHGTGAFPYHKDKTNRQWASQRFFLFTICIAFYWGMLHIMLIMGCCKFPPWHMALIGGPGVFLTHIQTPWTHNSPAYFTPEGIQKQKKHDINLKWETNAVLKAFPMTHGSANFQLIICRHIHHKIVTMVQISYEQENKSVPSSSWELYLLFFT